MQRRRRRKPKPVHSNPNGFTTDEAQTATLAYTEGTASCKGRKGYQYPRVVIGLCVKEGLAPAERAFKRAIYPAKSKRIRCKPQDFPPEGKGRWQFDLHPEDIQKLAPLIPKSYLDGWRKKWEERGCPPKPKRKRKRRA